jgi:excisionase family DNA binding protein
MDTKLDPLIKVKQICAWLQYGEKTVLDMARRGIIPSHKIGGEWRFDKAELRKWLQRGGGQKIR